MNDDDDEDSRSTTLQLPDYLGCLYLKEDWLGQPNVPLDLIALNQVIAIQIYRLQITKTTVGIYIFIYIHVYRYIQKLHLDLK